MSLINSFGGHKNDVDNVIRISNEFMNLASSPLIIYRIKPKEEQNSSDDVYGEYTYKKYYPGVELKGFFKNPTLVQNLVGMGLEMPETVSVTFNITEMQEKLGQVIHIYDIIQPYHQRNQFYTVMSSYPNQSTETLYKYTQWTVVMKKQEMEGLDLPKYLVFDKLLSWFPFDEHYLTTQIQDRESYKESRQSRIEGDINYFWQSDNSYYHSEIGYFNGIDNALNFHNHYDFKNQDFTLSIFIKPHFDSGISKMRLFKKGDDFDITIENDGRINLKLRNFTDSIPNAFVPDVWQQIVLTKINDRIRVYKDGVVNYLMSSSIPSENVIDNSENFYFGVGDYYSGDDTSFYKGLVSNLRIFNKGLLDDEVAIEYDNLKNRGFM